MVETGSLRVLNILSNASAVIAEGEVMQLGTKGNIGVTEDTYLKIVAAKTAALFAAAAGVIGLYLSYYLSIASGAAIVLTATAFFLLAFLWKRMKSV